MRASVFIVDVTLVAAKYQRLVNVQEDKVDKDVLQYHFF